MASSRMKADSPVLKAEANIRLDMLVRPTITQEDWSFVGNKTGVRLLFVDMKAPVETTYEKEVAKKPALDLGSETS